MIGTTPRGRGRRHSTFAAPLSSLISRTSRPPTSRTVFHVGPWIWNRQGWRGFSSISPRPTPRRRRTFTVSPRTIAGVAATGSCGHPDQASPCQFRARRTTPRDPESTAMDAVAPDAGIAGSPPPVRRLITCTITIRATSSASRGCRPALFSRRLSRPNVSLFLIASGTSRRMRSASCRDATVAWSAAAMLRIPSLPSRSPEAREPGPGSPRPAAPAARVDRGRASRGRPP